MRLSLVLCASLVGLLSACGGSGSSSGAATSSAAAASSTAAADSTADLFVATDGDDSNPGTADRPLRTVQKAIDTVQRGQTVLVRAGIYREGNLTIDRQDNATQPITFKAEPGVVLDYSLPVAGWQADGGGVFKALPQYEFADVGKWNNMVVVGEQPLRRVWRRDEMQQGTFFADADSGFVYAWADGGIDPGSVTTLVMNFYHVGLRISKSTSNLVFDGFTHRANMLGGHPRGLVIRHIARRLDSHFQSGIAVLFDHRLGVLARLLGSGAACALVDADLVSYAAAEQRPHGHSGGFARDVPQGVLDAAHGGVHDNSSREARGVIHHVEQVLHIARIVADQP